jgi:hypothetical protein
MKGRTKVGFVLLGLIMTGLVGYARHRSDAVLWLDFDMKNIPEPKEHVSGYYDAFFKGQLFEVTKQDLDIPRWIRLVAGNPRQARNINAVDEVPDSSWYTNRHHLRHMSIDELRRGPNRGNPPDFTTAVITKAKTAGVTPGLMVKDATGQAYLVKFDSVNYPNLQSGAEVISTKILYASGYNVPENYIGYIDPKALQIGKDVKTEDRKTGLERPLTQDDVDEMFQRVARRPDGRVRVLASKILPGKSKGPFPQIGFRSDDPNDLIPHEDRRELRALRVIGSWINNWDLKEAQSLDMYVEEGGRKFLRHYLLDFGSSLGADDKPTLYFPGHEYGLDLKNITKEVLSLGAYESPNEKQSRIISSEVGRFNNDDFDPGRWKPTFPSVMFNNMTAVDAFWAMRVILSFTEPELRSIVETGEYSDPASVNYITRTLIERRQMVARYWLNTVDGLSNLAVHQSAEGVALTFHDLMLDHGLTLAKYTEYTYQVSGPHYRSAKTRTSHPEIRINREELAAAIERGGKDPTVEVSIWTTRRNTTSVPVKVYFDWDPKRESFSIRRIARG